uniref:Regulator of chromosome condensation (RCC1) family protein n=1 Tax=Steinernema glaseri TaxID=37863 RepID=A0A1I7YC95_9BILA
MLPARINSPSLLSCALRTQYGKRLSSTAVYASGLSASGSFAAPSLVLNEHRGVTVSKPQRLGYCNDKNIKHIAAGFGFSLFASSEQVYGSGLNNHYQLGGPVRTTSIQRSEEWHIGGRKIPLPEDSGKILGVAAGRLHSLIATTSGVYAFGDNAHGQCGQNPEKKNVVLHARDGSIERVEIPSDSPVVKVHTCLDTSFVLLADGSLYSFGLSEDGQVGNGRFGITWRPSAVEGDLKGEKIISITGSTDTLIALSEKGNIVTHSPGVKTNMANSLLSPMRCR